jgi:hypothetical protein
VKLGAEIFVLCERYVKVAIFTVAAAYLQAKPDTIAKRLRGFEYQAASRMYHFAFEKTMWYSLLGIR